MSDNQNERCSVSNFLAGLGVGALIGAATAILLAPKTGSETREDIKNLTSDFTEKTGKITKELTESSHELLKKGKELLEVATTKVCEIVEAGKKAIENTAEEVEEQVEELVEEADKSEA